MEKLLGLKEAAGMLGVKQSTLRKWVYLGNVEYCKVGGMLKFTEAQIKACITTYSFSKSHKKEARYEGGCC